MKRTLTLFLLLVILFNSIGYYFFYEWYRNRIREEIFTHIARGPDQEKILVILIENNRDFKRTSREEFIYKDVHYDIVREYSLGRSTLFHCIRDLRETRLSGLFSKFSQQKAESDIWDNYVLICTPGPEFDLKPLRQFKTLPLRNDSGIRPPFLWSWCPPPDLS